MMYVKSEKKNGQKPLLLRQNVILTWTRFPDRKQGGSGEVVLSRSYYRQNKYFRVAKPWRTLSKLPLRNEGSRTTGREF
ncbi:hypothetical protein Y032_0197g1584 [Ancylostoma ceylanicum]|uniref:Uncharacterized protein n=1 Tax=Ancylostoma ceylanicum TaxID=53326 RepID=A0A016SPD7_9BILA|nr:hypothetical protein Y032_0197g1584 [Ancylostoma ceylanicum]